MDRVGRAPAVALAAACMALGLSVSGCGDPAPREAATAHGWSAEAVLCGYREKPDELSSLQPGQVMPLDGDPAMLLSTARCTDVEAEGDGTELEIEPGRSYFVVSTGDDRVDVVLVEIDAAADPVELVAEHHAVGPSCGRTADYRGQLMLLIEGPADATTPEVRLDELRLEC